MLRITIPQNFAPERKYILHVLFEEYLGLDIKVITGETDDYIIEIEEKVLTVKDCFWTGKSEYLNVESIPECVSWTKELKVFGQSVPVLFGKEEVLEEENQITCSIDLFASSFFMLTRWEEYVVKIRDEHDRFPAQESLAFKAGFLSLPVVNMYTELLWLFLQRLSPGLKRKEREFTLINTHDIDAPFMWRSVRNIFGRVKWHLKNKTIGVWFTYDLPSYLKCVFGISKDPYDTYDYLMDTSERADAKSYFFVMDYGTTIYDKYYRVSDRRMQSLFEKVYRRGHYLGFHPSYDLHKSQNQFDAGLKGLIDAIPGFQKVGRHHYLRFQVPHTWDLWNNAGMDWDCTLGYADVNGFRCGTCFEYPVFDVLNRNQLSLKEKPLLFMEQTSILSQRLTPVQMLDSAKKILHQVRLYRGDFVLLWHNPNFETPEYAPYKIVYEEILNTFVELKKSRR